MSHLLRKLENYSDFIEKNAKERVNWEFRETLIKAFPSLDLRCEAANSFANSCDPPEVFKETLI